MTGYLERIEWSRDDIVLDAIDRLRKCTEPDRKLDAAVARALGFRIAATTRGPHIMREGAAASRDLPAYSATAESRADAIQKLRARDALA